MDKINLQKERVKYLSADIYFLLVCKDLLALLSLVENSRQDQQRRKFHSLIKKIAAGGSLR